MKADDLTKLEAIALAGVIGGNAVPPGGADGMPGGPPGFGGGGGPGLDFGGPRLMDTPAAPNPEGRYWENSPPGAPSSPGLPSRPKGGPPRNMSVPFIRGVGPSR